MADVVVEVPEGEPAPGDVEMDEAGNDDAPAATGEDLPFPEGGELETRTSFISYLSSPVVTMLVGNGETETILTAHQALLTQSPFFADACSAFADDGSVRLYRSWIIHPISSAALRR